MKVISGFLKGRTIEGFSIEGTRPTMDRVKESLFATIQNYIDESVVLDLFSGSGNLGIEAISNGSGFVYFNDVNKEAVKFINKNIEKFNIKEKSRVLNLDYQKCLRTLKEENIKFDIIILDPPYMSGLYEKALYLISQYDLLNDEGIVVCEHEKSVEIDFLDYNIDKQKQYGIKVVTYLTK